MSLLVVGSIAFDNIITPLTEVKNSLGGSTTYISVAASHFTDKVAIVGVVGTDFGEENINIFKKHNIDITGLEIVPNGKTFFWAGKYHNDFNNRDSLATELNVFANFNPIIPEHLKKSSVVVLGNIDPVLHERVLNQLTEPKFIICDTMNYWIESRLNELLKILPRIDVLIINDSEARLLANEFNLIKAAKKILTYGPNYLVIKRGEHGASLFSRDQIFVAPAFPVENLVDPTGAGDTFAGGFAGFLYRKNDFGFDNLRRAVVYGSAMASFCVEEFSIKGIDNLTYEEIKYRYKKFVDISSF
ncbi:MAG TPA: PfkB family carbohydrate kinase [Ignavibacteriales bacterium]|nr:PfkB family carbohydrate kinase [Ignavibacteriales bacterium]